MLHTLFGDDINPLGHCWLVLVMSMLATLIHPPVRLPQVRVISQYTFTAGDPDLPIQYSSRMGHLDACHATLCMMWQGCLQREVVEEGGGSLVVLE